MVGLYYSASILAGRAFDPFVVPPCIVGGDQAKLNGVQKSLLAWRGVEAGREQSCSKTLMRLYL